VWATDRNVVDFIRVPTSQWGRSLLDQWYMPLLQWIFDYVISVAEEHCWFLCCCGIVVENAKYSEIHCFHTNGTPVWCDWHFGCLQAIEWAQSRSILIARCHCWFIINRNNRGTLNHMLCVCGKQACLLVDHHIIRIRILCSELRGWHRYWITSIMN
jgi:hypothetical protein